MFRYQIIIEYDGTNHSGWQSQKNAKSIQNEIETTLSKMMKKKIKIIGSGRTDAGVHSKNQSAHFDCKNLLSDKVATSASIVAKDIKIRNIVHKFQQKCAYSPPIKYAGSVLDGRDITTIQVKDAMFKFFITADLKTRAKRRYKEYKSLRKKITFKEVLKSLKNRDKSDRQRKHGPLKKTKDSILINTSKLSRKRCFIKIKAIMDRKLNN